jgi:hypothetical protein
MEVMSELGSKDGNDYTSALGNADSKCKGQAALGNTNDKLNDDCKLKGYNTWIHHKYIGREKE